MRAWKQKPGSQTLAPMTRLWDLRKLPDIPGPQFPITESPLELVFHSSLSNAYRNILVYNI